ncbi:DUF4870 domain-containing protein [Qipengyuania sp. JC766]|uniref:DUF4870 family protein n=1 Tax=Qipengyuania sp. JC766 TaxID=3232139 RepID=UPI0034576F7E
MSEFDRDGTPGTPPPPTQGSFDLNYPTVISLLYLSSFLVGITGIIGVVLAYVWKNEPHDPWMTSHYTYHIRTFWLGLVGMVIGFILTMVLIGVLVLMAVAVWTIIRTVLAMLKAQRREPIPDPQTLGF